MKKNQFHFRPGSREKIHCLQECLVVAIDLGFSNSKPSCGIAWKIDSTPTQAENLKFNETLNKICDLMSRHKRAVLVIEAPLSGAFDRLGNPVKRGTFEESNNNSVNGANRYWYSGPGAAMCLAAIFFLQKLVRNPCKKSREIFLYEGFLSFKPKGKKRSNHAEDAEKLLNCFFGGKKENFLSLKPPKNGGSLIKLLDILNGSISKQPSPEIICPK